VCPVDMSVCPVYKSLCPAVDIWVTEVWHRETRLCVWWRCRRCFCSLRCTCW